MLEGIVIISISAVIYTAIKLNLENKRKLNSIEAQQSIEAIKMFSKEIEELRTAYITHEIRNGFIDKYGIHYDFFNKKPYSKIKDPEVKCFKDIFSNINNNFKIWNNEYIEKELENNKNVFDNIDGKSLDSQQRRAVVMDETNCLVLAGAGSGKTLTISAKAKYLIDVKGVSPKDILLISYTKKAAEEMSERIKKIGIDIKSLTFHKLGLDIITNHLKKRPEICEKSKLIIKEYFEKNVIFDKSQMEDLISYFAYYLNVPKDLEEFDNLGDAYDYQKNIDFQTIRGKISQNQILKEKIAQRKSVKETIKGETVKSIEEVIIANFLFLNGIEYEYESKYPYESSDTYKKHYRPDFYLPAYKIYIEHFGINKEGKTPWLSSIEEEKYIEGIEWKRKTHQEHNTTLIETYSYYNSDGILLEKLKELLTEHNVSFKEADKEKIYMSLYQKASDKYLKEFMALVTTFINLFKSNQFCEETFDVFLKDANAIKNPYIKERTVLFIRIVKKVYSYYRDILNEQGEIDFNDMINLATGIIKEDEYKISYRYIIIDEYQDISISRYKLIKAIKDKTSAKIMCVGDDWQSIYRFAGSDIKLFTDFNSYFGYYELMKIEKTYRNSQELINITGNFIMQNKQQIAKELKSEKNVGSPIKPINYSFNKVDAFKKALDEILGSSKNNDTILALGRNNFDIEFLNESKDFVIKKNSEDIQVIYKNNTEAKIRFLTVHRSKGLEADNVILINNENELLGFPNKISDDPLLSYVLTDQDHYAYAEERRLFYVALTRTRNNAYLLIPERNPSVFFKEIMKYSAMENVEGENNSFTVYCPLCRSGKLVERTNGMGKSFLGCSNYPQCKYTNNNTNILYNQIICIKCGGFMIKKTGQWGPFLGCSNYPKCKHTQKL